MDMLVQSRICVGLPVSVANGNVICDVIDMLALETMRCDEMKMKRRLVSDYTALPVQHVTRNLRRGNNHMKTTDW